VLALVLGTLSICFAFQGSVFVTFILLCKVAPVVSICHRMVRRTMLAWTKPGIIRGRSKVLWKHDTRKASFCMQEGDGRLNGRHGAGRRCVGGIIRPIRGGFRLSCLGYMSGKRIGIQTVRLTRSCGCHGASAASNQSSCREILSTTTPSRAVPSVWDIGRKRSCLEIC
jgi:hypothetical protein